MSNSGVILGRALARQPGFLVQPYGNHLYARWDYGIGATPHCLIVGTSGGGKTALLRWMVLDTILSPGSKALYLGCGKGANSFLMYTGQPGIADITNKNHANPKEDPIVEMVKTVYVETQRRYRIFDEAKQRALRTGRGLNYDLPPLIVLSIDDYMDWEQGLPDRIRKQVLQWLVSIGQEGREVNVHLWLATQAPYARAVGEEGVPGLLKRQLKARIAMAGPMDLDDIESKMAFNDSKAGDRLESYARNWGLTGDDRKGLGMFAVGRREVAFKAPWVPDPLHWETTEAERQEILDLLPVKTHTLQIVEEVS